MKKTDKSFDINETLLKNKADAFLIAGDSRDSDMYYSTHFFASDAFTYLQTKNAKEILLVSEMERGRAEIESRISDIHTTQDYDYRSKIKARGDPSLAYTDCLAELLQQEGIRRISVPRTFPLFTAQSLKEDGFSVIPVKSPFKEMRARKDESEIDKIETVQDACEHAMKSAIEIISNAIVQDDVLYHRGYALTSDIVREAIEHKLLDFGCEAEGTIVACGKRSSNPHWAGEGVLKAKEPIVIDIFPRSKKNRYHADMTRTVIKGEPSRELADMYDAVLKAMNAAFEHIKPGVECREVHNAVCDAFERKGHKTIRDDAKAGFIHTTGHGVGLDVHELPSVGDNDTVLEKGNVITVEPGLYYPDIGGIRIEDMVVVTDEGYVNLTIFEKNFVL